MTLDLVWIAQFKDGSSIKQFDDIKLQTNEHAFKEVLDKQKDLSQFALVNIHSGVMYILNLKNGTIGMTANGFEELTPDADMLQNDYVYRLIYFRRVSRTFGLDLKEIDAPSLVYFLGYQFTDKNGANVKRLIKIHSDGRLITN